MVSNAQEKVDKVQGQLQEKIGDELQKDADQAETLLAQSNNLLDQAAVFKKKSKDKKKDEESTEKTSLLPSRIPGLGDGGGDPKKIIIYSIVGIAIVVILGKFFAAWL
jgi:hypothetical protein